MLNLALFGSPTVTQNGTSVTTFRSAKSVALLAYLVLEQQAAPTRSTLATLFWSNQEERKSRHNLTQTLARLRRDLGDRGRASRYFQTKGQTIRLRETAEIACDVVVFEGIIGRIHTHPHDDITTCDSCQNGLQQAVKLASGELLAGFEVGGGAELFEEWLVLRREYLYQQRLDVLYERTEGLLARGELNDALRYAREQVALESWREKAHQQLMRVFAGRGERALALQQYQTCAAVLRDELGVAPERETEMLREAIERGRLTARRESTEIASYLPAPTTPFIGRETEIAQLSQRLEARAYRLISIVGPGGIGKTRLALEVAQAYIGRFEDGVFFVPLEGVAAASDIPAAIAAALGLIFIGDGSPDKQLLRALKERRLLLIIDNLEHIIQDSTPLLLHLLAGAPHIVLLVTSRQELNVQAEDLFRLHGLPHPTAVVDLSSAGEFAAVRLFVERAHRLSKRFKLTDDNVRAVCDICHTVEGLPLGLELAASWIRDLDVHGIAAELQRDIDLLQTDLHDISPRHRSLASVFDYSWQLLTAEERGVLMRLSVFRSGFGSADANAIAAASPLTLQRLRKKSLLRNSGSRRYSLHELIRQLAGRKLAAQPDRLQQSQHSHSQHYLKRLATEAAHLNTTRAAAVAAVLRQDLNNIRRAWRIAVANEDAALLACAADGMRELYSHSGFNIEGAQLLQFASERIGDEDVLPLLLVNQLLLLDGRSTMAELEPLRERVLTLTTGNPRFIDLHIQVLLSRAYDVLEERRDGVAAYAILQKLLDRLNEQDVGPKTVARLYCAKSRVHLFEGAFDQAVEAAQKALAIYQSLGDLRGQSSAYSALAPAYAEGNRIGPGLICDREALRLCQLLDDQARLSACHSNLAHTYLLLGAYDVARSHLLQTLELAQAQGDELMIALGSWTYANVLIGLGDEHAAIDYFQRAIELLQTLNKSYFLGDALVGWGSLQRRIGRFAAAEITFKEAIALEKDEEHMRLTALMKLAELYLAQGRMAESVALADEVWTSSAPTGGRDLPSPIETLFLCHRVFAQAGDARADDALALAAAMLEHTAVEISDPEMREIFLSHELVNRALRATLERHTKVTNRIGQ